MNENYQDDQNNGKKANDFDIVWLITYLWAKRKRIYYIIGGCLALSIIIYIVKPKVYTATAAILPVYDSEDGGLGNLKGLASMAGINLGGSSSGGTVITPDLYSEVVTSTPALIEIMEKVPLTWSSPVDTVMTLYDHAVYDSVPSIGALILKYTIQLPFTIKQAISGEEPTVVFVEPIVRISVEGESAEQSAELATAVMQQIQTTITEYATSSAKKNLNFLQKRYDETMDEFTQARQEFFNYRDRHRDYVEERSSVERQQLEDKYNLSYSLLQSLQSEVEKSRMKLLAETPVFSIVEPVVQPDKKSSPKLLLHLIGGFMIGFIISVGGYLLILGYKQVFQPAQFKEIHDKYKVTEE